MEPVHITEFASERYYQKLEQEAKQRAASTTSAPAESSTTVQQQTVQAPFILPLRGSSQVEPTDDALANKTADHKQKNRFLSTFRFKSKAPLPTTAEQLIQQQQYQQPQLYQLERRTSVAESTRTRYVASVGAIPFSKVRCANRTTTASLSMSCSRAYPTSCRFRLSLPFLYQTY